MTEPLFTEAAVYDGDPMRPGLNTPTPAAVVGGLSPKDRRTRLAHLIDQAHGIYDDGVSKHLGRKSLAGSVILFSGGNDSTTLAHLFRGKATHAAHANTTIGIEQTRQFVRDTCKAWGLPLIEKVAPVPYRDLVVDQGFPGPGMHWKMYQRLKERPLREVRRELVRDSSQRVVFIAGRRRAESERRADIPLHERDGSVIWVSPIAMWTKLDLGTYRQMNPDVPHNEVSDLLHMSGECLCGAFAKPNELDEIGLWFPDVRAEIEDIQCDVRAAGHCSPLDRWGHGTGVRSKVGRLCSTCDLLFDGAP